MTTALPTELFAIVKSYMLLPKERYEMLRDIREHIVASNLGVMADIVMLVYNQNKILYKNKLVSPLSFIKQSTIPLETRRRYMISLVWRLIKCINPIRTDLLCKQMATHFTKSFRRYLNGDCYDNKYNWVMLRDIDSDISVRLTTLPATHTLHAVLPNRVWKSSVFMKLQIVGRDFNTLICREYKYNTIGSYEFYDEHGIKKYSLNISWLELGTQIYRINERSDVYDVKFSERQPQILQYSSNI
jgi:hypothetical protein